MVQLAVPAKFAKGQEVTVWFKYSDGHSEVLTIGQVLSVRVVGQMYLYTLIGCQNMPDGLFAAYEFELTEATGTDREELSKQS